MEHIKEHCDLFLPAELNGIKFQTGWYYLVDKKDLEPYISEDEKDSDYKSIVLSLDCYEFPFSGNVQYDATFFTDIKHIGISGRICAVVDKIENKEKAREEFLKKLQEELSKLNLKPDMEKLLERKNKITKDIEKLSIELSDLNQIFDARIEND